MAISLEKLEIGGEYNRPFLAELWGYTGHQAISRGIVTPDNDNKIILFITENKQSSETQYIDELIDKEILLMEGENKHGNDKRLINAKSNNEKIYLFHRDKHHNPFIYYGEFELIEYTEYVDKPSEFKLTKIN